MSKTLRLVSPLRSRKVLVALATVLGAYLAEAGLEVPTGILATILGVGVAVILGIAIEDHGTKSRPVTTLKPVDSGDNGNGKPK